MTAQSKLTGLKIIVVDDEPEAVLVLTDLLGFYGATVFEAEDGAQALELIKTVQPDLILTDISMPVMDGWELIKVLRETPATANIPVLALTANALPEDILRGLSLGFNSYLTKPLNAVTLLNDIIERVPSLGA